MNKDNFTTIIFVALAVVVGLSNCGFNLWTAFVSGCVGYVCAKITNYLEGRLF